MIATAIFLIMEILYTVRISFKERSLSAEPNPGGFNVWNGDMQYPIGSNLSCEVCHKVEMEDAVHHWNMEHMFRNTQVVENKVADR